MFSKTQILAFALSIASAEAAAKGFNYGANKPDGSLKVQADFEAEFHTAKNLEGTSGFNSARLYTMIQGGSSNTPISAIPAAIAEETTMLLGLWASGGNMDNEIAALKNAIDQYGEDFTKLVVGISVGSEDLYRDSEIGVQANAGIGVGPDELVNYINQVRDAVSGTSLSDASIGHVDTWNAWTNGSNAAVIDAVDWLGFDGYPYFQKEMQNSISDAKSLWDEAVGKTRAVAKGKEIWITEAGWPVSGDDQNLAEASVENAKIFWDEVGCPMFDKVNTWWYILQDAAGASVPNPSFGIVGNTLTTKPLFDLSCKASSNSSSSTTSAAGHSSTSAPSSASAASTGLVDASTGFASSTKPSGPSVTGGAGSNLGGADSWGSGLHPGASSSVIVTPSGSATPTPSHGAGSGSGSGVGSGSGSGSSSGAGAGAGTGSGSANEDSTSTSPESPDFTGAGSRLSGSICGAVLLVAALAVAL